MSLRFREAKTTQAAARLLTLRGGRMNYMNRWDLVELVHRFPEWQDPDGSALSITHRDILKAGGKSELEIAAILQDIAAVAQADALLPAL